MRPFLTTMLAALGLAATTTKSAAADLPPEVKPNASKIYLYVVPATYLEVGGTKSQTIAWPLGHGLHVALVHDLDGLVRNVIPNDLVGINLSSEEAKKQALGNLSTLFKSGDVKASRFKGPDGKPFILMGGHWATATCILLPDLHKFAASNIGADDLCVCIPHREALLIFAKGDKTYRDLMRKMIREKESDGRKPLSFELFNLTSAGLTELKD